jgi:hypothetical protein
MKVKDWSNEKVKEQYELYKHIIESVKESISDEYDSYARRKLESQLSIYKNSMALMGQELEIRKCYVKNKTAVDLSNLNFNSNKYILLIDNIQQNEKLINRKLKFVEHYFGLSCSVFSLKNSDINDFVYNDIRDIEEISMKLIESTETKLSFRELNFDALNLGNFGVTLNLSGAEIESWVFHVFPLKIDIIHY